MKPGPGFGSMRRQEKEKIRNEDHVCCHIERRKIKRKGREFILLCKLKENRGRGGGGEGASKTTEKNLGFFHLIVSCSKLSRIACI